MDAPLSQNNMMSKWASPFASSEINFKKLAFQFYRHIWIILAFSFVGGLLTFLYVQRIPPQYQSNSLIQVHGQSSLGETLGAAIKFNGTSSNPSGSEIALLKTRYILEPIVEQFSLNVTAVPHYLHYIGRPIATRYHGDALAKPFLGLKKYAWGGEKIDIKEMKVPSAYQSYHFRLVAGEKNTYKIFDSNGKLILDGVVGKVERSLSYPLSIEIASLKARPGTEFILHYLSLTKIANQLARSLKVTPISSEENLPTDLYQLQFTNNDPLRTSEILDNIVLAAIDRNIQRKVEEAQKTLRFVNKKLPELGDELNESESKLNEYHAKSGTLSMASATGLIMQQVKIVLQMLETVRAQKEDLLQVYTPEHPRVCAVIHKEEALEKKYKELQEQIKKLPYKNQEELNMLRQVRLKNFAFTSLLSQKQNLELMKAGIVGDIVLLSYATSANEIPTHKLLTILAGFVLGAFFPILFITARNLLSRFVEDADELESEFNIPVRAIIPYSRKQKQLVKMREKRFDLSEKPLILAREDMHELAIESLRSLRMSLHIMNPGLSNSVILLTGSVSGIGKSFISLNLAYLLADMGKKTLLIDADLRRGLLHKALSQSKSPGMSEYLEGKASLSHIVRSISENFYFLPAGNYVKHPLELFHSQHYVELIESLKNEYERIVIDTPPMLAVSDSILIARTADIKLFVVNAADDKFADVKTSIKKAKSHGIEFQGFVLNHKKSTIPYGTHYYYKRYAYETTK